MLTRNFGTSSLQVSALGFGAGHIGYDGVTERDAHVLLDRALDLGVNFIDTARGYGLSEERIGRWLPAHRDEVVLSTKVGYGVEGATDWSAAAVTGGVEEALRTLGTDVLDVVFLHSCPLAVLERGEAAQALLSCVDAGKVRVPGYSGENEALAWAAGAGVFGAVQSSVNLADQRSLREVLPEASRQGARRRREASARQRALAPQRTAGAASTARRTGCGCASWGWNRNPMTGREPPSASRHSRPEWAPRSWGPPGPRTSRLRQPPSRADRCRSPSGHGGRTPSPRMPASGPGEV